MHSQSLAAALLLPSLSPHTICLLPSGHTTCRQAITAASLFPGFVFLAAAAGVGSGVGGSGGASLL